MQLSSALLSATALLAQVASGFYLSSPDDPTPQPGYAEVIGDDVGFRKGNGTLASIQLDEEGDIEKSGFMFQAWVGASSYALVPTASKTVGPNDLTKPFVIENGEFVYKGEGEYQWFLAFDGDIAKIHLNIPRDAVPPPFFPGANIHFNITLLAHERKQGGKVNETGV
ncbi:uncharacterized protein B0H64DRAFT_471756 [Chaetomium fimeti]|uniref:Uncharacterized protein n=1 Tax=Chaetomium fimeti TaxID=1854472 RepID=A0AAE0HKY2_9PEZI|nr:hypothetical protein B0H64DRAFT_471756 [Chaetomium fimeti]